VNTVGPVSALVQFQIRTSRGSCINQTFVGLTSNRMPGLDIFRYYCFATCTCTCTCIVNNICVASVTTFVDKPCDAWVQVTEVVVTLGKVAAAVTTIVGSLLVNSNKTAAGLLVYS
jgi:hypothetical protein